jgi:chitinase
MSFRKARGSQRLRNRELVRIAVCDLVVLTEQEMKMTLRNVIYYNDNGNQIPLAEIANQLYTDVIIGFLVPGPDGTTLVGGGGPNGGAFDDQLQNNIRILQNAGKRVLISVGGSTFPSSSYQFFADGWNVAALVRQIVNFVTYYHFDGVDIDYEDDAGFGDNRTYEGIGFLSVLTLLLAGNLPSGQNIITHAPQTPYWDSNSEFAAGGIAPYYQIWQNVGNQIDWINNQFYNNSDYDSFAARKVEYYQAIVGLIGGPQKLLLGAPISADAAEGYLPLDQMINDVIAPLTATYGTQFGGVMGWQFSLDIDGVWGNGIGNAFGDVLAGIPLERDLPAMTNNR